MREKLNQDEDSDGRCLELEGVRVSDSTGAAAGSGLAEVTWTLGRGEFWALGGGPGSGKSGLLMTMSGVVRPAAGRVRWFGREAGTGVAEVALRSRVGMVFAEGGRLLHQLTLAENVALPICYHRNCRPFEVGALVTALLEFAGLGGFADVLPGRVRPALRQRAGLVRALGVNPDLMLVDDPASGLGGTELTWWREALGRLHAGHELTNGKPLSLVVAVQDLRPWRDRATRFAVLGGGACRVIGDRAALAGSEDETVRELVAGG